MRTCFALMAATSFAISFFIFWKAVVRSWASSMSNHARSDFRKQKFSSVTVLAVAILALKALASQTRASWLKTSVLATSSLHAASALQFAGTDPHPVTLSYFQTKFHNPSLLSHCSAVKRRDHPGWMKLSVHSEYICFALCATCAKAQIYSLCRQRLCYENISHRPWSSCAHLRQKLSAQSSTIQKVPFIRLRTASCQDRLLYF